MITQDKISNRNLMFKFFIIPIGSLPAFLGPHSNLTPSYLKNIINEISTRVKFFLILYRNVTISNSKDFDANNSSENDIPEFKIKNNVLG